MSHPNIKTPQPSQPSRRHNSTNMDPIRKAIEDVELCEDSTSLSHREVAKRRGCDRTTLSQRHQMKTRPNAAAALARSPLARPTTRARTRGIYQKIHKKRFATDARDGTEFREFDRESRDFPGLGFALPSPSQGRDHT